MKAILVIDVQMTEDGKHPIPKKKNEKIVIKGHTGEIAEAYQSGWNDCIDEILGETE